MKTIIAYLKCLVTKTIQEQEGQSLIKEILSEGKVLDM